MRQRLVAVKDRTVNWVRANRKPSIIMGGAAATLLTVAATGTFAVTANQTEDTRPLAALSTTSTTGRIFPAASQGATQNQTPGQVQPNTTQSPTPEQANGASGQNAASPVGPSGPLAGPTRPQAAPAAPRPTATPAPAPSPTNPPAQTPLSLPAPDGAQLRELVVSATDVTDTFLPEDPRVAIEVNASDNRGYITRISVNWQSGSMPEVRNWGLEGCSTNGLNPPSSNRKERFEHDYEAGGGYNVVVSVTSSDCNGTNERTSLTRVNLTAASGSTTTVPTTTPPVSTPSTQVQ